MIGYSVPVENCDIEDFSALKAYREERQKWLSWYELRDEEPHTIQQQIFSMMYLDMVYRILAEARVTVSEDEEISSKTSLLGHFVDQGYVATQILAIRRLLDNDKDVISVRRLLNDVTKHRRLLTREIYVCHDGVPYDPESWQKLPASAETKIWGIDAPGLTKYVSSRYRHERFDRLAGVSASERKREDLIREDVFQKLRHWLESIPAKKLVLLSHKFFAHAADMGSRGSLQYSGVSLDDIRDVHRSIIRVERAIMDDLLFLGIARNVVPMEPLGFFKGLDLPYVSTSAIPDMHTNWKNLTQEREAWTEGVLAELTK